MPPAAAAKSLQSCLTLCDPMDGSPPVSSVHEILQANILEWVAMPPPGNLADWTISLMSLRSPALAVCSVSLVTPGKPWRIQNDYQKSRVKEVCHRMVQCMLILENVLFLKTHTHTHTHTQRYTKFAPIRGYFF